jgi:hypothetical protein
MLLQAVGAQRALRVRLANPLTQGAASATYAMLLDGAFGLRSWPRRLSQRARRSLRSGALASGAPCCLHVPYKKKAPHAAGPKFLGTNASCAKFENIILKVLED